MSIKEFDINLEILNNNGKKYFPNRDIRYNEREEIKLKILTDVKIIDISSTLTTHFKENYVFFCCLLKNMFGLEKGDHILFAFANDKDFYPKEYFGYDGCNEFEILYLKNKEQLSNFDINNNLWKEKIWHNSKNKKIHYITKKINIKIKCKVVLEYKEDSA